MVLSHSKPEMADKSPYIPRVCREKSHTIFNQTKYTGTTGGLFTGAPTMSEIKKKVLQARSLVSMNVY